MNNSWKRCSNGRKRERENRGAIDMCASFALCSTSPFYSLAEASSSGPPKKSRGTLGSLERLIVRAIPGTSSVVVRTGSSHTHTATERVFEYFFNFPPHKAPPDSQSNLSCQLAFAAELAQWWWYLWRSYIDRYKAACELD